MREHKLVLGKIDYNNSGRRNCKAVLTWELHEGRFSMCGEIWNPRETDCYCCGQCVDTVAAYFSNNAKVQRMLAIWKRWHLNDMKAGSPAQQEWLETNPVKAVYPESHYEVASAKLAEAGLNPDPNFIRNGKPYKYGTAWLKEEIPADVVAEIESWG